MLSLLLSWGKTYLRYVRVSRIRVGMFVCFPPCCCGGSSPLLLSLSSVNFFYIFLYVYLLYMYTYIRIYVYIHNNINRILYQSFYRVIQYKDKSKDNSSCISPKDNSSCISSWDCKRAEKMFKLTIIASDNNPCVNPASCTTSQKYAIKMAANFALLALIKDVCRTWPHLLLKYASISASKAKLEDILMPYFFDVLVG